MRRRGGWIGVGGGGKAGNRVKETGLPHFSLAALPHTHTHHIDHKRPSSNHKHRPPFDAPKRREIAPLGLVRFLFLPITVRPRPYFIPEFFITEFSSGI